MNLAIDLKSVSERKEVSVYAVKDIEMIRTKIESLNFSNHKAIYRINTVLKMRHIEGIGII